MNALNWLNNQGLITGYLTRFTLSRFFMPAHTHHSENTFCESESHRYLPVPTHVSLQHSETTLNNPKSYKMFRERWRYVLATYFILVNHNIPERALKPDCFIQNCDALLIVINVAATFSLLLKAKQHQKPLHNYLYKSNTRMLSVSQEAVIYFRHCNKKVESYFRSISLFTSSNTNYLVMSQNSAKLVKAES